MTRKSPETETPHRPSPRSGQALIEFALLAPRIFVLLVGVADLGFCSFAAISVQNAARAGALYASSSLAAASDNPGACVVVSKELQSLPNYGDFNAACSSTPLQVTTEKLDSGIDGSPAARVTVSYQTIPLVPVPLLFSGPVTFIRIAEMPLRVD